jgi:arginine/lysine/ornithine decarboxylase
MKSELDKITTEKPPTTFIKEYRKEINIDDIVNFFSNNNSDVKNQIISGRVYQKNKKIKSVETIFKLLQEEVSKLESKNNKDLDSSFFNLNKKILYHQYVYNIKEIINLYDIDRR